MSKKGSKVLEHEKRKVNLKKGQKLSDIREEALHDFRPKAHKMIDDTVKGSFVLIALTYDKKGIPLGSQIMSAVIGPDLESLEVLMALDSAKRHVMKAGLESLMEGLLPK